jgi:glycerol-3-phosphate cytidylyltransferase
MSKKILTYGTFDLFHIGHLNLLKQLKGMGDTLIVGVSTDEFNELKGKRTIIGFEQRIQIVNSIRYVDGVFPEQTWEQKVDDIKTYNVDTFAIGNDWQGKFDHLKDYCDVVYLPRTEGISSTNLRSLIASFKKGDVENLKKALDIISSIVYQFE